MEPQTWMRENWPNCKAVDHDWTMERYDYPQNVRDWIKENWIKVSDENGGTYQEPEYYKKRIQDQQDQQPKNPQDNGQSFAKKYKKTTGAAEPLGPAGLDPRRFFLFFMRRSAHSQTGTLPPSFYFIKNGG